MLTCYVNGQCLTIKQPIVAADTIDYITAEFIFRTNEWDGLTKIAVFRQGEVTHTALLVDDKIEADAHVNLTEGDWEVGLIGESIDGEEIVRRITTELKTISVDRAAPNGGDPFPEYAGGVGEQIVAKAAEYMESAKDAESSASMHAMIANSAANFAANERYFAEEAKEQAVAAKDAAVDAKEYIEGIAIDIGIIGELITKDIGDWYHYDHTSDVTYSANFLKTGSPIKSWPEATMMRSAISPVRTVGDDLYIFAFGYKWTRESMAMLPMEVFATVEQLYRRFLIDDKVVTYGVREALTKDIYVVSFGYKQGKWFYTNTRMDGSKIEAYWDEGSLDFSSFVVRYSDAATPYADDVNLDDDTLKAIQSKLDISTKLSELDTDTEHRTVTDAEKAAWNAKSNFSGFYYDLIGKPSIPDRLSSLEQDSTHRTVTDAEKAIWNSQSAPFTSNLLKGDGRGGMIEATPSRDYVDYNRDVGLSMVKSSYMFTSRTNFSVAAGDTTKIGGGTVLLKGYQKIELEGPSATLNGVDIATVDDIPQVPIGNGMLKGDGQGGITTANPGVDYIEQSGAELIASTIAGAMADDVRRSIPTSLSDLSDDIAHRTVTDGEKAVWNAKYAKPITGIPKTHFTSAVQSSLDKADSAVQPDALDTKLAQLMRFYEVTVEGPESNLHFVKDGVTLTYDDLVAKYEDPQYFLFVEYQGLTFIPSLPPMAGDEILEFTCQWIYGDKVQTSRLIINESNQVKYETKICAEQSTLHVYTRNTGTLTVTLEDNSEYEFNACNDVHLVFPSTRFESHIRFNFGSTLNVVFPADAHYIGDAPQFEELTSWEISIKDGVIVAGKVE